MSDYGLPIARDDDDNPEAVDFEYEWGGADVKIKLIPPTLEQIQQFRQQARADGGDALEQARELIDDHVVKPAIPKDKLTEREANCFLDGILAYGDEGGGPMMDEVRDDIDERQDASQGN